LRERTLGNVDDSLLPPRGDVRSALTNATLATFQPDNGRWKITGGTDRSGDGLDMAVVFENAIVVITVF
jgi:hypothetical protein